MNLANLHCLCSIPNSDFVEVLVPEKEYEYGLKTHVRVDDDGYLSIPKKPGLGAERNLALSLKSDFSLIFLPYTFGRPRCGFLGLGAG